MRYKKLIVIGAGAAGMFAAIRAKALNPQLDVLVLEAAPKPLGKVKISGGGRCNVTHACFDIGQLIQYYPRGQKALRSVFSRFAPQDTVHWFESHGVQLKTEPDGRMFPVTDESQTIIDCLLSEAHRLNIHLLTRHAVQQLLWNGDGFWCQTSQGNVGADVILLSPGGHAKAYPWAQAFGHTIVPPVPSLFTFNITDPLISHLAGISFSNVNAWLYAQGSTAKPIAASGPLLITHWGLSGPVVLRLSAWGARVLHESVYHARLVVDLLPQTSQDEAATLLMDQKRQTPKKQLSNESPFPFSRRFWQQWLAVRASVNSQDIWQAVSDKQCRQWAEELKHTEFQVQGKGQFKDEFVTAGGVALDGINFKTMESKHRPGLFFAGEIIDVDGLTGGFNFQNAWSTGWIAGTAIGEGPAMG